MSGVRSQLFGTLEDIFKCTKNFFQSKDMLDFHVLQSELELQILKRGSFKISKQ